MERAAASEGKIGEIEREIVDLRTNINSLELKYLGLLIDQGHALPRRDEDLK